jgi:hypothetical protein
VSNSDPLFARSINIGSRTDRRFRDRKIDPTAAFLSRLGDKRTRCEEAEIGAFDPKRGRQMTLPML